MSGGCGCGGGNGLLVGRNGVSVTGNNTAGSPIQVSVVKDATSCEIIQDCAGDILCAGSGLIYDDQRGCLGVKISPKPANDLGTGSDGGLWLGSVTSVIDQRCGHTVDDLPVPMCAGYAGLGRNAGPIGDRKAIWQAINSGLDAVWIGCQVTCDGAPFVNALADLDSGTLSPNPGKATRAATAGQVLSLSYRWSAYTGAAGTDECPALMSLCDYLDTTAGRIVTLLYIQGQTAEEQTEMIARIVEHCAQRSVIAIVRDTSELPGLARWQEAGIETGSLVNGTTGLPTAGDVVAAGGRWVVVHNSATDAALSSYVNVGLQVLTYGSARRLDVDRGQALGARGTLAWDAPYQCRLTVPLRDAPWCYDGVPSGQLTDRDGETQFLGWQGTRDKARGCGWKFSGQSDVKGQRRQTITLGNMADPDLTSYTVTFGLYFNDLSVSGATASETGLIICARDDTNPTPPPHQELSSRTTGYAAMFRHRGSGLVLRRMPAETGAPLAQSSGSGNAAVRTAYHFRIRISPNLVDFVRLDARDGTPTGAPLISTTDVTYRGPYLHLYKIQRFGTETWTPVDVTFDYVRIREGV